ncbi:TPA: O112ab family O-antigen flippase, partial [Escherichia coli]|nr:O112ab family O-antigen flippase [Escherichia coli]
MNLLKGTIIYTLSNLTIKFGAVLLLPILTHLLNPEEYGMVGLYVTLTSFLTIILGLGFYTPLMKTQSEQKSNIATSSHVNFCAIIFLIAVYLLLLLFLYFILKSSLVIDLLGEVKLDSKLIYLAVIVSMFSAINIIMNTSFRMDENYILVAILSILSFVLFYSSAII